MKYRRLEVPYVTDINLLVSRFPNSNIPNGYEKIPIDINIADLRLQLNEIRNKPAKKGNNDKEEEKKHDPITEMTVKLLS